MNNSLVSEAVPRGTFNSSSTEVERRKDMYDLAPALNFVSRHLDEYKAAYRRFLNQPARTEFPVKFLNPTTTKGIQLNQEEMSSVLDRMPKPLLDLTLLTTVDFVYAGTIPVPIFKEDGRRERENMVSFEEFPRKGDHPSRMLIGYSTGNAIFPSALPGKVFKDKDACWFYQLHVFIHEFFHTIEYLRRNNSGRKKIKLERGASKFTLDDWWKEWEDLFLHPDHPKYPTRYAATYAEKLTPHLRKSNSVEFTHALAEQICESFVGYILGIVPNDKNVSSFRTHSPELWELMSLLCTARVRK